MGLKGEAPPDVVVPIHSHADRETFHILAGERGGRDNLTFVQLIAS